MNFLIILLIICLYQFFYTCAPDMVPRKGTKPCAKIYFIKLYLTCWPVNLSIQLMSDKYNYKLSIKL